MSGKKITLEDLARVIKNLTETVSDLSNAAGTRFDKIDARFDKIDARFDKVDEDIQETRETLTRAIKELEGKFVATTAYSREEIDRLRSWMESIESRLSVLEGKKNRKTV